MAAIPLLWAATFRGLPRADAAWLAETLRVTRGAADDGFPSAPRGVEEAHAPSIRVRALLETGVKAVR